MKPRKLEHGLRMISAGIPYALPSGHGDNDVPTFWILLYWGQAGCCGRLNFTGI